MHETKFFKDILEIIRSEQAKHTDKRIKCLHFELSEFGGWDEAHFRQHIREAFRETELQNVSFEIMKVELGPEARLVSISFESRQGI